MATLLAVLVGGAVFYIYVTGHLARVSDGTNPAVTDFAPGYKRAAVMQIRFALVPFRNALMPAFFGFIRLFLIQNFPPAYARKINLQTGI